MSACLGTNPVRMCLVMDWCMWCLCSDVWMIQCVPAFMLWPMPMRMCVWCVCLCSCAGRGGVASDA
jgi:hypothetical protein